MELGYFHYLVMIENLNLRLVPKFRLYHILRGFQSAQGTFFLGYEWIKV